MTEPENQNDTPPVAETAVEQTIPVPEAEPVAMQPAEEENAPAMQPFVRTPVVQQKVQGDPAGEPLVGEAKGTLPLLAMPSALDAGLEAALNHLPENFERPQHWAEVLEVAENVASNGEFESALADQTRDWRRVVTHENKRLGAQSISTPSITGKEVSGDQAVMAWRSHSRASAGASVFFWGSGFSAKFNAMSNDRMYHLQRELASSRITAGRSTYGVALSQHMVYTAEGILQAARDTLFKSSLAPGVDLGDALRITDFHTLVWALAVAAFPHGFDIERSCIADPTTCNHTVRERLAVRRMQIVDQNAISDEQRAWMATLQDDKVTLEDLQNYQTKFTKAKTSEYTLQHDDGRTSVMGLRVPTINEFIRDGKLWIDDVNRATVQAIGETASFGERTRMMAELMQLANARQYSHWLEYLSFDGGKIVHHETLRRILTDDISAEDNLLVQFIDAVRQHNEKTAVSIIAINNFRCPACKKHQIVVKGHEGEEEQPATYVPVEAVSTFFGLMYQKLEMVPK